MALANQYVDARYSTFNHVGRDQYNLVVGQDEEDIGERTSILIED